MDRKDTITGVVKELVPSMIEEALEKHQEKTTETMKDLLSGFMKEFKSENKKEINTEDIKKEISKDTETEKKEDPNAALMEVAKTLSEAVIALKDTNSGRKGLAEGEEEIDDGTPKKVLKSVTDPDTLSYAIYAANDQDVYDSLTKSEKAKVTNFYFQVNDAVHGK